MLITKIFFTKPNSKFLFCKQTIMTILLFVPIGCFCDIFLKILNILKSFRLPNYLTILLVIFLLTSCSNPINRQIIISQPNQNELSAIPQPPVKLTPALSLQTQPSQIIINKKIRIATLLPISGKDKEIGTSILNSIILSLFENDHNNDLELVVFDNKGNPDDTKKAINNIISQNIKIVIGPIFSSNVESISEIAYQNNLTILSLSNNQNLANKKGIFLMGFLPEQQIERLTSYSISTGNNNISIIAPNNQYGFKFSAILKEMVNRKDGNLVSSQFYLNSNKDLERAVAKTLNSYLVSPQAANTKTKDLQPEDKIYSNTIFIPESGIILSKINDLIRKLNTSERPIQIIGSSNWDDISTLNDPNLIGGWFVSAAPAKYSDFEKRYYRTYNKFPPRISSIGYDAVLALLEVIKSSTKRDLLPTDLINYQSSKNGFDGIDGLFRFLPNGLVQRNFAILQIGNGKFEMIDSPNTMFFKY